MSRGLMIDNQNERLVGCQQELLQTRERHHERARAAHNSKNYTDLGVTTIATLPRSVEAHMPIRGGSNPSTTL